MQKNVPSKFNIKIIAKSSNGEDGDPQLIARELH